MTTIRSRVEEILRRGPMTATEITAELGDVPHGTVSATLSQLRTVARCGDEKPTRWQLAGTPAAVKPAIPRVDNSLAERIVLALACGEATLNEVAEKVETPGATVHEVLRSLGELGAVTAGRVDGRICWRLADDGREFPPGLLKELSQKARKAHAVVTRVIGEQPPENVPAPTFVPPNAPDVPEPRLPEPPAIAATAPPAEPPPAPALRPRRKNVSTIVRQAVYVPELRVSVININEVLIETCNPTTGEGDGVVVPFADVPALMEALREAIRI